MLLWPERKKFGIIRLQKELALYCMTKQNIVEENITVWTACRASQLKKIWRCMKRFAEASTESQGEQKCQKMVKICFISKTTTPSA